MSKKDKMEERWKTTDVLPESIKPDNDLTVAPQLPTVSVTPDKADYAARMLQIRRDMPITECPTNLDLETLHGKSMALAAMSPADIEFDKNGVAYIVATHWICFPDEGPDEQTGEMKEFTRTVLFNSQGSTYRTTSAHAPKRLSAMLRLFSPEEWAKGLPLIIRERKGPRSKGVYHDIRVAANKEQHNES